MKISELIKLLETKLVTIGDVEVAILDDETGTFDPVEGGFRYYNPETGIDEFDLMTGRQIEESEV